MMAVDVVGIETPYGVESLDVGEGKRGLKSWGIGETEIGSVPVYNSARSSAGGS